LHIIINLQNTYSSAIPVPFLRIPVPFRWIPADSGAIPVDSGAIPADSGGFRTESVGHQKVQSMSHTNPAGSITPRGLKKLFILYSGI